MFGKSVLESGKKRALLSELRAMSKGAKTPRGAPGNTETDATATSAKHSADDRGLFLGAAVGFRQPLLVYGNRRAFALMLWWSWIYCF
jgi:hypothetical protein